MGSITLSIVTQNNQAFVARCLESIYAAPPSVPFEVFVVDNASRDGSAESIRRDYPQVHLIRNPVRGGFSANHNQVFRRTCTDHVALLNDDTIVMPRAVDVLTGYLDANPAVGALGCKLLYPDRRFQTSFGGIPTPLSELCGIWTTSRFYQRLLSPWFLMRYRFPMEVGWLTGAALFIRRKAAEEVSYLDEDYTAYYEDVDLCYRMAKKGWKVVYHPGAEIIHHRGATRAQELVHNLILIYRSREVFFGKHFDRRTLRRLHVATTLELSARILLLLPFLLFQRQEKKEALDMTKAYSRLLFRRGRSSSS